MRHVTKATAVPSMILMASKTKGGKTAMEMAKENTKRTTMEKTTTATGRSPGVRAGAKDAFASLSSVLFEVDISLLIRVGR